MTSVRRRFAGQRVDARVAGDVALRRRGRRDLEGRRRRAARRAQGDEARVGRAHGRADARSPLDRWAIPSPNRAAWCRSRGSRGRASTARPSRRRTACMSPRRSRGTASRPARAAGAPKPAENPDLSPGAPSRAERPVRRSSVVRDEGTSSRHRGDPAGPADTAAAIPRAHHGVN